LCGRRVDDAVGRHPQPGDKPCGEPVDSRWTTVDNAVRSAGLWMDTLWARGVHPPLIHRCITRLSSLNAGDPQNPQERRRRLLVLWRKRKTIIGWGRFVDGEPGRTRSRHDGYDWVRIAGGSARSSGSGVAGWATQLAW